MAPCYTQPISNTEDHIHYTADHIHQLRTCLLERICTCSLLVRFGFPALILSDFLTKRRQRDKVQLRTAVLISKIIFACIYPIIL